MNSSLYPPLLILKDMIRNHSKQISCDRRFDDYVTNHVLPLLRMAQSWAETFEIQHAEEYITLVLSVFTINYICFAHW